MRAREQNREQGQEQGQEQDRRQGQNQDRNQDRRKEEQKEQNQNQNQEQGQKQGYGRPASMETAEIRPMTAGDLHPVWRLEQQCFSDPWSMKLLADSLAGQYDRFFVAETEGRICGYGNLRIIAGEGEIERIAVDSRFRGRGIGRKLMERMEESAGEEGVRDITLEVREGNLAARKLYESCGFAEEGRRKEYYRNPTEDAVIMWRRKA